LAHSPETVSWPFRLYATLKTGFKLKKAGDYQS